MTTVVGLLETVYGFPIRLNSVLSMCIDAPESTANSLSSGFITDGAVGEKRELCPFL